MGDLARALPLEIRRALVDAMRLLHERGLINLRGGNASALYGFSEEAVFVYITPSGVAKPLMRPEDIAVMDLGGNVYEGRPSSEYRMHLAVYRRRSDARAIVHAHNPLTVLARRLGLELDTSVLGVEARYYLGDCVAVVPRVEPGTQELAERVADALASSECYAAVLEEHGAVAIGTSEDPVRAVYEAVDRLEVLEDLARAIIFSRIIRG